MHRAVISLFFRIDMKELRREWDGSAVGAGSGAVGTLCPAAPLMKYICFISPTEKGKRDHAAFSPWSGSIATTEVSPPVPSACLILTGFGLEQSLVYSAGIFSSATWILFFSCHLA